MFGFKKRPDQVDRLQALLELQVEFRRLQSDPPAAAWFFARNLYNAHPRVDTAEGVDETIAHLKRELASPQPVKNIGVDGGMEIFALRFLLAYMVAIKRGENEIAFNTTFRTIKEQGERYRDLTPKDNEPPADAALRTILRNGGYASLSEIIAGVQEDYRTIPGSEVEAFESCQTIIAGFDIKQEASSGRLLPHAERLEDIIGRM